MNNQLPTSNDVAVYIRNLLIDNDEVYVSNDKLARIIKRYAEVYVNAACKELKTNIISELEARVHHGALNAIKKMALKDLQIK